MAKTSIKKNLYFEIKEKVIEEAFNGYRVYKKKAFVKVFGLDSTRDVRARLIEILYDRVNYHKDKFIAKILHDEMGTMEQKRNGKVEHSDGNHDDQVFSYLMALYVWYDGKDLMTNFGLQKNIIKTDEDEEVITGDIENDESLEVIDLTEVGKEDDPSGLAEQLDYLAQASRFKLGYMLNNELYLDDQRKTEQLLQTNRDFRNAYNEKYHIDADDMQRGFVTIPDSVFIDDEDLLMEEQKAFNGNMYDMFNSL